eukprot:4832853-Pyramimonas_sp.AAC.2
MRAMGSASKPIHQFQEPLRGGLVELIWAQDLVQDLPELRMFSNPPRYNLHFWFLCHREEGEGGPGTVGGLPEVRTRPDNAGLRMQT